MIISHNLMAMNTSRMLNITNKKKATLTEKLSSGYKINRAADDAAGLAISEKMRHQIRGLNMGANNIQEGVGYCQTADGALNEIQDMLHRINELSIKAANGTLSPSDREAINDEMNHLKSEINRICETTKYNEEYIFKGEEKFEAYQLEFSGNPKDVYIYNETYDDATGTATYGGIAYDGIRYAWSSIDANMYDEQTGMFNEGTYTLQAHDGASLMLECEAGSTPPSVTRMYNCTAQSNGIVVNDDLIEWSEVQTIFGDTFDPSHIVYEPYYFSYHGVTIGFEPEIGENFEEIVKRLEGIEWRSSYKVPYQETAVTMDMGSSQINLVSRADVKAYLNNTLGDYIMRADTDGVWLEQNGADVADSKKTWAQLGITNWGDQSSDIWSDKVYNYSFTASTGESILIELELINETSKDTVIDALDGVVIQNSNLHLDNKSELDFTTTSKLLSGKVTTDTTKITLEEEYELGRSFASDNETYASQSLAYDGTQFSVGFSGTEDVYDQGNSTTKQYTSGGTALDSTIATIKNQMKADSNEYLKLILARRKAGAKNPEDLNLSSLIGGDKITGSGSDTYLESVYSFDSTNVNLKITEDLKLDATYAGAQIDFSGLGTEYQLSDLLGMGFDSTCQTCNNHYSLQFANSDLYSGSWNTATIDGNDYKYSLVRSGSDYNLYIDIDSMKDSSAFSVGTADMGATFTDVLLDVINESNYDFHFTQYATESGGSVLYVVDNRPQYASGGTSSAKSATFSPYAYTADTTTNIKLKLTDTEDASEYIAMEFTYDYGDLFAGDKLKYTYVPDQTGKYVLNPNNNTYELYDYTNADHVNWDHYSLDKVELDTQGMAMDDYLESYIKNNIFADIANNSKMSLTGEKAAYSLSGTVNNNKAMVTTFNTPEQIRSEEGEGVRDILRIQCSSDVDDYIGIERAKLSIRKLGLKSASALTEARALKTMDLVDDALKQVSTIRSRFGAYQNRLESAYDSNRNVSENTQAAESIIRDTDMATAMVELSMQNILEQAGVSMLAQANKMNQGVMSLLE